jgi:hypothetical protein
MLTPSLRISEAEQQAESLFRASLERATQLMLEEGCLILENLFPRPWIDKLSAAFFERLQGHDEAQLIRSGVPVGDRRYMYLQPLSPPFDSPYYYANGLVLPILQNLLGHDCVINTSSVVMALPGAQAQKMHRDNELPFGANPLSGQIPPLAINLAIPLVDLSPETGATVLHPGSHRKIRPSGSFDFEGITPAYLRKGDAYLMDFRLVHAGTPNISMQLRPVIYLIYARHWYLDAENHLNRGQNYLDVPDTTLLQATPAQAHLLSRGRLRVCKTALTPEGL